MKNLIHLTAIAALAASGLTNAQTAAYSKPSGYATQILYANQFNLVGLTLHNSPIASGVIDEASGTLLTDNDGALSVDSGRTYVLEITSGSIAGTIQSIPAASITSTTITTSDDLPSMGLLVGDAYSIRLAPTIEEIFGVDANSALTRAAISSTADIVWVPNGFGGYNKYFIHLATGTVRVEGSQTLAPNVPVIYSDGLLVQKKNTQTTLTLTGQVKTKATNTVVSQGFNLISIVSPTGATLFNAGLEDDLTSTAITGTSDLVWVPQTNGSYIKYFRHISGNWRVADTFTNITVDVPLPSAILIQRRSSTPANVDLTPPAAYSSL